MRRKLRTGHKGASTGGPASQQLRGMIDAALASIEADLLDAGRGMDFRRTGPRRAGPLPEPEVLKAQRLERLKELHGIFAAIKRRLDRGRP